MWIKIKALEKTKSFYNVELKKEGLTESERAKYLKALDLIEKIIKEKEAKKEMSKIDKSRIQKRNLGNIKRV